LKTVICGIKPRRERKNPTRYELELRLIETQKLLEQGYNGKQIAEKLGVGKSTGERYVQTVTKRNKAQWDELRSDSLQDRALLIKHHYEDLAKECEEILHDKSKSPIARIEAGKTLVACHNNIFYMLREGPLKLPKIETKAFEDKNEI
jgi:IS30 family transposase